MNSILKDSVLLFFVVRAASVVRDWLYPLRTHATMERIELQGASCLTEDGSVEVLHASKSFFRCCLGRGTLAVQRSDWHHVTTTSFSF